MKTSPSNSALLLCTALSTCAQTHAQEFIDSHRSIDLSLILTDPLGPVHSEFSGLGAYNEDLELHDLDLVTGSFAESQLLHNSIISGVQQFFDGSFYTFGAVEGIANASSTLESEFVLSDAGSISGYLQLLNFSLDDPDGLTIQLEIIGQNSGVVYSANFSDLMGSGNMLRHAWSLDLEADTYTATHTLSASAANDNRNWGSYQFGMFIPAPSTGVTLGLASFVLTHRRRT